MVSSLLAFASIFASLSVVNAQSYLNNTNTNCATSSDVDYLRTYYYDPNDTMDWGFYTQSTGTCDTGSYARVHVIDPSGNDIDCGHVPLDGNLDLISCSNYPRGYMQEGQYTLYWETVPSVGQYSWNQFNVIHSQSSVTAPTPTQSVTTTPITLLTTTLTNSPTNTVYVPQSTVTTPSATVTNTVNITPLPTTITTTSTSWFSIVNKKYALTTLTAVTTAPCTRASITKDYTATRGSTTSSSSNKKIATTKTTRESLLNLFGLINILRKRDDTPNTVGIIGLALTTTYTPDPVIQTITAALSTSVVTSTTNLAAVTVTSVNPTPTLTVYSGMAVQTITNTLAQKTSSVVKVKMSVTMVTSTVWMTYTQVVKTTPVCAPTGV